MSVRALIGLVLFIVPSDNKATGLAKLGRAAQGNPARASDLEAGVTCHSETPRGRENPLIRSPKIANVTPKDTA